MTLFQQVRKIKLKLKSSFGFLNQRLGLVLGPINTTARALNALRQVDSIWSNLAVNTLSLSGQMVPFIQDTKIKFVMDGPLNIIADDNTYTFTPSAESGTVYNSSTAINVYYGTRYPVGLGAYWSAPFVDQPLPNPHIHFPTADLGSNPPTRDLGDGDHAYILAHELGHVLGLDESSIFNNAVCQGASFINISGGCCNQICADDYVLETNIFWAPCGTPGGSNNMMSENIGCHNYFSPQQMAIMHYNLRTDLRNYLSASGYTAATERNPAFDYNVTTNEIWQDGDRYFKGNISVKANKTLTIKCRVAMTTRSNITVEPGAQLIIDGGHITNISGRMWTGIKVLGNPNQSQTATNPNNPGAFLYQGLVRMKNGAKISNATFGVQNFSGTWTNAGGVLFAQNSIFLNNKWDVALESANNQAPKVNGSWIYNCNFETSGFLNDASSPPTDHIYLYRVKGVAIKGCTIQCLPYHYSPGNGIRSIDASYVVQENGNNPTVFKNLSRGIFVNNINLMTVPNISGCIFQDNQKFAAYFLNAHYLSFVSNTIIIPPTSGSEGVYLNNSRFYTIKGNSFTTSGPALNASGLLIYKSQAGAHSVYKNNFSKLRVGINCMDNNSGQSNVIDGLQMNCNKFNTGVFNDYDVALTYTTGMNAPTVMQKQGENNPLNQTPAKLVRNIYGAICGNENKWYIHSQTTKQILHGSNTNSVAAVTQPTPQTGTANCSRPLLSIGNSSINLDYPNHCPLNPPSSGGSSTVQSQRLAIMSDYLSGLKANGNQDDYFEIEATLGNKLNVFLSDSLESNHGLDSAMAIYANNQQYLPDTKTLEFFGYLLKGELAQAYTKANTIKNTDPELGELLFKLKQLEEDTLGLFRIKEDAGLRSFFENYATNPEVSGHSIAQAALFAASGQGYSEPVAYPETGGSARQAQQSEVHLSEGIIKNNANAFIINISPNPAESHLLVAVGELSDKQQLYSISDLTGKVISNGNLKTGANHINIETLTNGMYFINVKDANMHIYSQKFVVSKN